MFIPNLLAFGAVKAVAYSSLGGVVRLRAGKKGNPIIFGFVRMCLGWLVGLPVILGVGAVLDPSNNVMIASLAVPRLALSAFLLQNFFQPLGGRREVALWAALSVVVASVIDVILLDNYQQVEWLRMGWC